MHRAGRQRSRYSLAKQATDGRAAVLAEALPELVQAAEGGALRVARLRYEHVDGMLVRLVVYRPGLLVGDREPRVGLDRRCRLDDLAHHSPQVPRGVVAAAVHVDGNGALVPPASHREQARAGDMLHAGHLYLRNSLVGWSRCFFASRFASSPAVFFRRKVVATVVN